MPLTPFQLRLSRLLSKNRTVDSYLAGAAALHLRPNSRRYSNDLDYFQDSAERVAQAFEADRGLLTQEGIVVAVEMNQPGFIRVVARSGEELTKIEWAHDSAWRFLPPIKDPDAGFLLHPVDLGLNKLLALVGRDEARDFLDILFVDEEILPLGALVWAAAGKDPGFTPLSLLELLKRRGRHRPEDFARLHLSAPLDLPALKTRWLSALTQAEAFIEGRPAAEHGCLYYSPKLKKFVAPAPGEDASVVAHFGRPGGVLPRLYAGDSLAERFGALEP